MADDILGASLTIDITGLRAGLNAANRAIRESETEFKQAAAGMGDWEQSSEGLEARLKHLNNTISQHEAVIARTTEEKERIVKAMQAEGKSQEEINQAVDSANKILNKEYDALSKATKERNKHTKALEKFSAETEDGADELEDLGKESKKADKNLDKLNETVKDTGGGFTIAKGAIAGFVANGLTAIVGAAKNAVSSLFNLTESTLEYRTELGKLTTVADEVGASGDAIIDKWIDLGAVLGDKGAVTEGLNNLLSAGFKSEEQMAAITKQLEGASIKFKDTLKFEGLSDSLQEWIGSDGVNLTGNFAELLERLGYNLEDVQKATKGMTDEQRRNWAIQTLNKEGLGELSDNYREANADLIEYNKAVSEQEHAQASLGEKMQPLVTQFKTATADMLYSFLDIIEGVPNASENLINQVNDLFERVLNKVTEFAPRVIEMGSQLIISLVQTIADNLPKITQAAIDIVNTLISTIGDMLPELIPQFVEAVLLMAETLINNVDQLVDAGIKLIEGLVRGIVQSFPIIVQKAPEIVSKLISGIVSNLPRILQTGVQLLLELLNGWQQAIPDMLAKIPELIVQLAKGLLTEGIPTLIEAGGQLLAGLFEGMLNPKMIWENIKSIGKSIWNGFKSFFGIHSPSTLMRDEIGRYLGEGMALGIPDGFNKQIGGVNKAIVKALGSDSLSIGGGANGLASGRVNGSGGVVVNQYNNYTKAHSRYEIFQSKQATAAAVRLAMRGTT